MQRRVRTTKKLAQRVDMNYFKYPHPFRRWKTWLAIGLPLIAVVWIGWAAFANEKEMYSSGAVSVSHQVFGQQCAACHEVQEDTFRKHVTDLGCKTCHDGPPHEMPDQKTHRARVAVRGNEPVKIECGTCHVEHNAAVRLAAVDDKNCIECHGNLALSSDSPSPSIETKIGGFNAGHPEFAVVRTKKEDPGVIKLNHQTHLREGLSGPKGRVLLECGDCHRAPGTREAWPYGEARFRTASASKKEPAPLAGKTSNRYMAPVRHAYACASCHQLDFDRRITESIPHDWSGEKSEAEIVREFINRKFREYLAKNPNAWREPPAERRQLPGKPVEQAAVARSAEEWLRQAVADSENVVWNKTCKLCHTINTAPGKDPKVERPEAYFEVEKLWMPRARFDHEPHRLMKCEDCHTDVRKSIKTADLLMPKIAECQQCHAPGKAEYRCFECHDYHDWTQKQRTKGKFSIRELTTSMRLQATPSEAPKAETKQK